MVWIVVWESEYFLFMVDLVNFMIRMVFFDDRLMVVSSVIWK